jgi:dihydroflavonol-4-reductase
VQVLVTGSTGFVGGQLCRGLVEQGHAVRAFHRATSTLRILEDLPVEHVVGDLTKPDSLLAAMEGVEAVFHAAALLGGGQPGRMYAVTVEGTRAVLAAAREAGVRRVVHTSSVAALGIPVDGMRLNENSTWNYRTDLWPYGYAKYLAEQEVQKAVAAGQDVVIVNPSLVLGPGDVYRQTRSLIVQAANGRVPLAVEGGLNVVHVADVVAGHLAALERGQTGERYLLGGENITHEALLGLIAEVAGVPAPRVTMPGRAARRFARLLQPLEGLLQLPVSMHTLRMAGLYFWLDTLKSQAELGLSAPRPVRAAIQDAYAWFVQAGAIRRSRSSSG